MIASAAVRLFSGTFLNSGGLFINTGLIVGDEQLQFSGRTAGSPVNPVTETNGPFRLHQGASRTNVGVPNAELNRCALHRRQTHRIDGEDRGGAPFPRGRKTGRLDPARIQAAGPGGRRTTTGVRRGYLEQLGPHPHRVVNPEPYASGVFENAYRPQVLQTA